jgi:hypothetical protein
MQGCLSNRANHTDTSMACVYFSGPSSGCLVHQHLALEESVLILLYHWDLCGWKSRCYLLRLVTSERNPKYQKGWSFFFFSATIRFSYVRKFDVAFRKDQIIARLLERINPKLPHADASRSLYLGSGVHQSAVARSSTFMRFMWRKTRRHRRIFKTEISVIKSTY